MICDIVLEMIMKRTTVKLNHPKPKDANLKVS